MIYFLVGRLPWQDLPIGNKKEKYERIQELKASLTPETVCKGLPQEFVVLLKYSISLSFYECPNYKFLFSILNDLMTKNRFSRDNKFDWLNNVEFQIKYSKLGLGEPLTPKKRGERIDEEENYHKETMSEGVKGIKIQPTITQLCLRGNKSRLGQFISENKGWLNSDVSNPNVSEIEIKKQIISRTNIQPNCFLSAMNINIKSVSSFSDAGRVLLETSQGVNTSKFNIHTNMLISEDMNKSESFSNVLQINPIGKSEKHVHRDSLSGMKSNRAVSPNVEKVVIQVKSEMAESFKFPSERKKPEEKKRNEKKKKEKTPKRERSEEDFEENSLKEKSPKLSKHQNANTMKNPFV